ncbi:TetR/AcrR family transcriptional regulator [Novosphingobium resinovorum]|uniref:HTH tetR-type domain-containing protein n=1 Tax=Novosphingobium resinovorum TaxID=158500 RepID=A0A1D8AEG0_9SPHN|nr:TetR family transcriptional regulator [Novosphingobium resinovorum]AOR80508.1 hypothetical protein BES08_27015 [Novosphingobium resinovorum]
MSKVENAAKTKPKAKAKPKGQNKVGQVMRNKGLSTRRRIIDQTMLLLRETPAHRLSSADVARACGLTPPALYLYFAGVPEVVLARLEEIMTLRHPYMDMLEEPWPETQLWDRARRFVRAYAAYWQEYEVALHYRNLMSEQGDERFMRMRVEMTKPIGKRLEQRVAESQQSGFIPKELSVPETAGAALSLVDHCAATASSPYGSFGDSRWDRDRFLDAAAFMLIGMVRGKYRSDEEAAAAAG